jgi:Raf kinase inhibitor-like YbhB/YbcL family protein
MTRGGHAAGCMRTWTALALVAVGLAGCTAGDGDGADETGQDAAEGLRLVSASFSNGEAIPERHTCDGAETSPPLRITGGPVGTRSFALLVLDPDVPTPDAPTQTLTHWVVWNISAPGPVTFPEGGVPSGATEGSNDFGEGWLGPCPPPGSPPHRYNFTVFALDFRPTLPSDAGREELEAAIQGHVLDNDRLIGTYERAL